MMKTILAAIKNDIFRKELLFQSENLIFTGIYKEYLYVGFYLLLAIAAAFVFNLVFELSKK